MSIASEIQRIQGNIADAYNACSAKGATMPVTNNSASLANTVDSISAGGGGELGALGIGKYYVNNGVAMPQAGDVSDAFKSITTISNFGMNNACSNMQSITGVANFSNLTSIGDNGLYYAFFNCHNITGVNFPVLTNINSYGMYWAFANCVNLSGDISFGMNEIDGSNTMSYSFVGTNIGNVSFPNLQYIKGYNAMQSCFGRIGTFGSNIISVNMCNLEQINYAGLQAAFQNCKKLVNADFSGLQLVNSYGMTGTFQDCWNLTEAHFNSLSSIAGYSFNYCFQNCYNLTTLSFPAIVNCSRGGGEFCMLCSRCYNLTNINFENLASLNLNNAFYNAFQYCNNLTTVYFNSMNYINGAVFSGCFYGCSRLQDIYFPALTPDSFPSHRSQFDAMLWNVNGCNVHFPAAVQSTIGSWSEVTGGFSGTNTTVLFDL